MNSTKSKISWGLVSLLLISSGCAFLASERGQRVLKIAARRATVEVVSRKPESREAFQATEVFLRYTCTNSVTLKEFSDAFASLRIREFCDDLLVKDALDILDILVLERARERDTNGLCRTALTFASGIQEGLAFVPSLPTITVNTNTP